jgi:hypothetical protein
MTQTTSLHQIKSLYHATVLASVEAFRKQEIAYKKYGLGSPEHVVTVKAYMSLCEEKEALKAQWIAVKKAQG